MEIEFKTKNGLHEVAEVHINKADYKSLYNQLLNEQLKKSNIHGFRPGQTPRSFLEKRIGTSLKIRSILEVAEHDANMKLFEEKKNRFTDIIYAPDQKLDEKWLQIEPHKLTFEYVVRPNLNLEISKLTIPDIFEVIIEDEIVDKELNYYLKRTGNFEKDYPEVDMNSLISINIIEYKDNVKNVLSNSVILVEEIKNEKILNQLIGLKKDNRFVISLKEIEKFENDKKLLLNKYDAPKGDIEFEIVSISKITPAEITPEFLSQFGNDVKDVEKVKEIIKNGLFNNYKNQAKNLFLNEFIDKIIEKNKFDLPKEFFVNFYKQRFPDKLDNFELNYPSYEKSIKISIIEDILIEKNNIDINDDAFKNYLKEQLKEDYKQRGQEYNEEYAEQMVEGHLKYIKENGDKNKTKENFKMDSIYFKIIEILKPNPKKIKSKEFNEKLSKL